MLDFFEEKCFFCKKKYDGESFESNDFKYTNFFKPMKKYSIYCNECEVGTNFDYDHTKDILTFKNANIYYGHLNKFSTSQHHIRDLIKLYPCQNSYLVQGSWTIYDEFITDSNILNAPHEKIDDFSGEINQDYSNYYQGFEKIIELSQLNIKKYLIDLYEYEYNKIYLLLKDDMKLKKEEMQTNLMFS